MYLYTGACGAGKLVFAHDCCNPALVSVSVGHFLYEMLAGQELNVPKAETQHISNARSSALGAQVRVILQWSACFISC